MLPKSFADLLGREFHMYYAQMAITDANHVRDYCKRSETIERNVNRCQFHKFPIPAAGGFPFCALSLKHTCALLAECAYVRDRRPNVIATYYTST